MAKKRTIDLENAEPLRDLPSSGIQVNYKHQTIIASDETSEYALLTRGKKCEANIGVAYIRPEPEPAINYIPLTINDTATASHATRTGFGTVVAEVNNKLFTTLEMSEAIGVIPFIENDEYMVGIEVSASSDVLNVVVNNTPLSFDATMYMYLYTFSSAEYPTGITITITDKTDGR